MEGQYFALSTEQIIEQCNATQCSSKNYTPLFFRYFSIDIFRYSLEVKASGY